MKKETKGCHTKHHRNETRMDEYFSIFCHFLFLFWCVRAGVNRCGHFSRILSNISFPFLFVGWTSRFLVFSLPLSFYINRYKYI